MSPPPARLGLWVLPRVAPAWLRTLGCTLLRVRPHSTSKLQRLAAACLVSVCVIASCLNRPVGTQEPNTTNVFVNVLGNPAIDKIDLLFMIDGSLSMADKQLMLSEAVPQLVRRLIDPLCVPEAGGAGIAASEGECPAGYVRQFDPIDDIHIGVVSSSLGSVNTDTCDSAFGNDNAHLIGTLRTDSEMQPLNSYAGRGFLAWDPAGKKAARGEPPGESNATALVEDLQDMVAATDENGCGLEASLEAWYRFLIQPDPPLRWEVDPETDRASPVGLDEVLLEQRRQFLRGDSLVAVIMLSDENDCSMDPSGSGWLAGDRNFRMPRGTAACLDDPSDPCCRPCQAEARTPSGCVPIESDTECAKGNTLSDAEDPGNLRCWQQKRRFGVDLLYPVERYVQGLTQASVPNRDGELVDNPLYLDLERGGRARRGVDLVFLAGIVGVPWQDIATEASLQDPELLAFLDSEQLELEQRWDLILGQPGANVPPEDPLMRESVAPREGVHPIVEVPLAGPESTTALAHPINGHEYVASMDLQYACIFPLMSPAACEGSHCDCNQQAEDRRSPLCQDPDSGAYGPLQHFAKAYPGLRQLEVLRELGTSGIVASICPKLPPQTGTAGTVNPNAGYNPAVEALLQAISDKLSGACVPRELKPDPVSQQVPCAVVEALVPPPGASCGSCSDIAGRTDIGPKLIGPVRKRLREQERVCDQGGVACEDVCLCEIEQLSGDSLASCQNEVTSTEQGYCYLDANRGIGNPALVEDCSGRRGLRFVGDETPRPGALTFIACTGAKL